MSSAMEVEDTPMAMSTDENSVLMPTIEGDNSSAPLTASLDEQPGSTHPPMSEEMEHESTPPPMNAEDDIAPVPPNPNPEPPLPTISPEGNVESTSPAPSAPEEMGHEPSQSAIPTESNLEPAAPIASSEMDHVPSQPAPASEGNAPPTTSSDMDYEPSQPVVTSDGDLPPPAAPISEMEVDSRPNTASSEGSTPNNDSEDEDDDTTPTETPSEDAEPKPPVKTAREELESQIMAAVAAGNLDLTKSLYPTDLLMKMASGAAKAEHTEILTWTFERGLTIPPESSNNRVIHSVFESGSPSVYQVFLDKGLDLNKHSSDYYGDALAYACMQGNIPLIKFLIEKGHDVNSGRRCNGRLGVVWAVTHDSYSQDIGLQIINLLLSKGLNVVGTGAAIAAAEKENLDALKILLDAGAGMEEKCVWWKQGRDREEGTALFRACLRGRELAVDYLLCRGAKKNACSWEGRGCVEVADAKGHKGVVRLLEVMGVSVEWPD